MADTITVAVIPVRGGSVGIPRKNARIISGKPLLAYSIEASLSSRCINGVYVSTDDPELSEIALRFGAKVISRPDTLAGDNITLDEVICHTADQLRNSGIEFDLLATIQATVPLIQPKTIDRAVTKCVMENLDTVLAVVNDPHLAWSRDSVNNLFPLYRSRENRQQLPPYYKETGGVVIARDRILRTGSRFGKAVGVIEVDKVESLDIDDYFDWWLVEKSLSRRRICFHVIGNRMTGLGHVYRALSLADRLIDHDICFLINDEADLAEELIGKRFYPYTKVPAGQALEYIIKDQPDLLINDILDTDAGFMQGLRDAGITTINFEDLGTGSMDADYLVNALYDTHPSRKGDNTFHGVKYDCLRDEFFSVSPISVSKEVRNILVLFGGTDPSDLTLKCLGWLDEIAGDWEISVITGLGYQNADAVREFAARSRHRTEVINDTTIISRHMKNADLAITSAGRTVLELASLGIPMLVATQNEREQHHAFALTSPGTVFLGPAAKLTRDAFAEALVEVTSSWILRKKMSQSCLDADISNGIHRILEIIGKALQKKVPEDKQP